jgi:hypothetical protein
LTGIPGIARTDFITLPKQFLRHFASFASPFLRGAFDWNNTVKFGVK